MNNLEWFERVYTNLEDALYETCELIEEIIENDCFSISISEGEKHPSIQVEYSIPDLDYEGEPLTIYFDPYNQEFYFIESDEGPEVRFMLKSFEDIIDYIHHAVHNTSIEGFLGTNDEAGDFPFLQSDEDKELFESMGEGFTPNDIHWVTEEILTAEETFGEPTNQTNVISYRLGKIEPMNQFIIVRFDTVFVNNQKVSKQGAMFPFNKGEEFVIQNLLNTSIYNG